jgi:hypothetical protein
MADPDGNTVLDERKGGDTNSDHLILDMNEYKDVLKRSSYRYFKTKEKKQDE